MEKVRITKSLANDTITILNVYKKGVEVAKKPTFGKKRKQLDNLLIDLDYLIGEYKKVISSKN